MAEPQSAMQDVVDVTIELQEEIRELSSYCLQRAEDGLAHPDERSAYEDVAIRLRKILDGEK